MRRALLFFLLPLAAFAQDRAAGIVYNSTVVTNAAWRRDVVMRHEPTGEIYNDQGRVGSAAEVAAANTAADGAAEMAEAAHDSMTNQVHRLDVVQTATDGVTDTQWVWCNWAVDFPPNRFVVYRGFGQCATNKFSWTDWGSVTNVTVNGRTWYGCHRGTVTRPDWARGESCLDLPNDRLGGPSGFDFGDLTVTVGGRVPFTGFVTNNISGEVLYFDQGFNKGSPTEGL